MTAYEIGIIAWVALSCAATPFIGRLLHQTGALRSSAIRIPALADQLSATATGRSSLRSTRIEGVYMLHVRMPRELRGYHNRHQGPHTQAEYIIAFTGLALFWVIVIGDVVFNLLAYWGPR